MNEQMKEFISFSGKFFQGIYYYLKKIIKGNPSTATMENSKEMP